MTKLTFCSVPEASETEMKFAVIAARYNAQWIYCRHRSRTTWEVPGGHWEAGESIDETARRELWEETGAVNAEISPVCAYCVTKDASSTWGMLYFADVKHLDSIPSGSEIEEIRCFDGLPEELTYPDIQPELFQRVQEWINTQN